MGGKPRRAAGAAILTGAAVALALGAALAYANSANRTHGDARAVFQAGPTGGLASYVHSANHHGAPAGGVPSGSPEDIRIYPVLEDAEYCTSGWHLIGLVYGDDPAFFGGKRALSDYLADVDIEFALDGRPLETERTAVKRFADPQRFGLEDAFVFHAAAFLPPGSLPPGSHTVVTTIDDPIYGLDSWPAQFTVLSC
jgi:hypothetical protein